MTQLSIAGTVGYILDPDAPADRDSWCTPKWLTDVLPAVDVDPCSNDRSTVRSVGRYQLDRGENGLELPWFGLVFVNPPYSDILPWAGKLEQERRRITGCAFLVNEAHDTRWWKHLVKRGGLRHRLDFDRRIAFTPPPGAAPSGNDRAQTLLLDDGFLAQCSNDLLCCGTLWSAR